MYDLFPFNFFAFFNTRLVIYLWIVHGLFTSDFLLYAACLFFYSLSTLVYSGVIILVFSLHVSVSLYYFQHTQKVNNRSLQQHVVRPSVSNEHSPNHDEQNLSSKKPVKLIQQHERNIRSRDDKIEQTREHSQGRGGHIKFSFQTYEGKHPSKSFVEKKTELGQSYQHGGSIAENYHNSGTEIRYSPRWGSVVGLVHVITLCCVIMSSLVV